MPTPETITFEGLAPVNDSTVVPSPYDDLNWGAISVLDKGLYTGDPDGYEAVVHGRDVAYAQGKASFSADSNDFSLKSGHFAAAWNTGLHVTFRAFHDGVRVGHQTATLDQVDTFIKFNDGFKHIDKVVIVTSGGTHGTGEGSGTHVAFDNLNVLFFGSLPATTHPHEVDHAAIADALNAHHVAPSLDAHDCLF